MTGRKGQDGPAPRRADQPGQPVAPAGGPGARPPEGPRIGEPYVQRFGDRPDGPIRHVTVRLGAGGVIGASLEDGAITVLLGSDRLLVSLTAAGPGSQFERALNLLRLHMPDLRDP